MDRSSWVGAFLLLLAPLTGRGAEPALAEEQSLLGMIAPPQQWSAYIEAGLNFPRSGGDAALYLLSERTAPCRNLYLLAVEPGSSQAQRLLMEIAETEFEERRRIGRNQVAIVRGKVHWIACDTEFRPEIATILYLSQKLDVGIKDIFLSPFSPEALDQMVETSGLSREAIFRAATTVWIVEGLGRDAIRLRMETILGAAFSERTYARIWDEIVRKDRQEHQPLISDLELTQSREILRQMTQICAPRSAQNLLDLLDVHWKNLPSPPDLLVVVEWDELDAFRRALKDFDLHGKVFDPEYLLRLFKKELAGVGEEWFGSNDALVRKWGAVAQALATDPARIHLASARESTAPLLVEFLPVSKPSESVTPSPPQESKPVAVVTIDRKFASQLVDPMRDPADALDPRMRRVLLKPWLAKEIAGIQELRSNPEWLVAREAIWALLLREIESVGVEGRLFDPEGVRELAARASVRYLLNLALKVEGFDVAAGVPEFLRYLRHEQISLEEVAMTAKPFPDGCAAAGFLSDIGTWMKWPENIPDEEIRRRFMIAHMIQAILYGSECDPRVPIYRLAFEIARAQEGQTNSPERWYTDAFDVKSRVPKGDLLLFLKEELRQGDLDRAVIERNVLQMNAEQAFSVQSPGTR